MYTYRGSEKWHWGIYGFPHVGIYFSFNLRRNKRLLPYFSIKGLLRVYTINSKTRILKIKNFFIVPEKIYFILLEFLKYSIGFKTYFICRYGPITYYLLEIVFKTKFLTKP